MISSASERPSTFVRREAKTITACSLAFLAVILYTIYSTDTAYYYPRVVTDQLRYFLKGLWLVQHGTTDARAAVNAAPFPYAAAPGILRAPLIALFGDFDQQLRAIQISNALMAIALAVMSAYIVSAALPKAAHRAAVVASFGVLLLNPVWVTNVLSLLADLPYAIASLGAVILLTRLITGDPAERSSRWRKALFLLLFIIAFGCRFTAPVILLYGLVLAKTRTRSVQSPRIPWLAGLIVGAVLIALLAVNSGTIVRGYLPALAHFYRHADKGGMVLNTLGAGIPSVIIPGFELLFGHPPTSRMLDPVFAKSAADLALLVAGLSITGVIATGMWIARHEHAALLAYLIAPLPAIGAMTQSTSRYLLSYQPFYWIFAIAGACAIARKVLPNFAWTRRNLAAAALILAATGCSALYVRSLRLTPDEPVSATNFSLGSTRRRAAIVATTFRDLRQFLESLPRSRTLIVGEPRAAGQWTVIAGVLHYHLDSAVAATSAKKDLYLATWCANRKDCTGFDAYDAALRARVQKFGQVHFEKVFDESHPYSTARVYRIRPGM